MVRTIFIFLLLFNCRNNTTNNKLTEVNNIMIDKNINAISTTRAPTDSLSITKLPYSFQYDYE